MKFFDKINGIFNSSKRIRPLGIQSYLSEDEKTYTITVANAFSQKNCFEKINMIIKALVDGDELFFGFYRIDGITLTNEEWKKCDREIPLFFKTDGEYREITEKVIDRKGIEKEYGGYLTVAKAPVSEQLYGNMSRILQYYLETAFFVPEADFDEFVTDFSDYMKSPDDYIEKGLTSLYFKYYDSRNFSVSFDVEKYDVKSVCDIVNRAFGTVEYN